jgi:drug/metabolite transporter (DMT)-like permease
VKKTGLYIALSTIFFSLMEIALKSVGDAFNPIQINLIRFFIGGVVLLPFAIRTLRIQGMMIHWRDLGLFALTGFMCLVVSMTLFQLSIGYTQASTVAVVFSANPVFALIFSFLILHERLGRANLIAVIISIVGLLVIVNPANLTDPLGLTLAIISALTFGLYSIISRYGSVRRGYNGIVMTCFTFLVGSAELLALVEITNIPGNCAGILTYWVVEAVQCDPTIYECEFTLFLVSIFCGRLCYRRWFCVLLLGNGDVECFDGFTGVLYQTRTSSYFCGTLDW